MHTIRWCHASSEPANPVRYKTWICNAPLLLATGVPARNQAGPERQRQVGRPGSGPARQDRGGVRGGLRGAVPGDAGPGGRRRALRGPVRRDAGPDPRADRRRVPVVPGLALGDGAHRRVLRPRHGVLVAPDPGAAARGLPPRRGLLLREVRHVRPPVRGLRLREDVLLPLWRAARELARGGARHRWLALAELDRD